MNKRGDMGAGMIVLMAAMMLGMFLFGGHMRHKNHNKEKHAQELGQLNDDKGRKNETNEHANH
ncbi:MAG: hypothetical protein HYT79_04515 [Elusimicrobia bacterium]|nr:hypothetical protein [Elusimicrobiota bacterium]